MAYADIPDTEIEPGKPGSSSLFTKMRDNPEAIAAGESGAPKIVNAAFNDNTIQASKIVDATIYNAKIMDGTIQNGKVANGVLDFSVKMLSHDAPAGTWTLPLNTNFIIPKGIWILVNHSVSMPLVILYHNGTSWVESGDDIQPETSKLLIGDGLNCALFNDAPTDNFVTRKLF